MSKKKLTIRLTEAEYELFCELQSKHKCSTLNKAFSTILVNYNYLADRVDQLGDGISRVSSENRELRRRADASSSVIRNFRLLLDGKLDFDDLPF